MPRKQAALKVLDPTDPLPPSQLRELERRMRDATDPTRYLVVSVLGPRFVLYYDVGGDSWLVNDARGATLFKRRAAALAIKRILRDGVRVTPCRVDRRGQIIRRSIETAPAPARRRRRVTTT